MRLSSWPPSDVSDAELGSAMERRLSPEEILGKRRLYVGESGKICIEGRLSSSRELSAEDRLRLYRKQQRG